MEYIINASLLCSHSFQVKALIQSEFKPLWLCEASQSVRTLNIKQTIKILFKMIVLIEFLKILT